MAPAYLVFPFIALSPVVTIVMALIISKERATTKGWVGIALAVVAGVYSFPAARQPVGDSAAEHHRGGKSRPHRGPERQAEGDSQIQHPARKSPSRFLWVVLAALVLLAWGIQGFAISHANKTMKAESIFFYMMLTRSPAHPCRPGYDRLYASQSIGDSRGQTWRPSSKSSIRSVPCCWSMRSATARRSSCRH